MIRTLQVILKEIGQYNFDDPSLTTLDMYFARCIEDEYNHLTNFSMNGRVTILLSHLVKRKPIDVSFSKVVNSITNSIKFNRSSSEKGSSENFYCNALMKNSTFSVDIGDLEESSLQLTESRHRINYSTISDEDEDEDTTEALTKAYRRQSLLPVSVPAPHEEPLDHLELEVSSDEPESNIIHCKTISSSINSQYGLENIVLNQFILS